MGDGEARVLVLVFPEDGVVDYCIAQYVVSFNFRFLEEYLKGLFPTSVNSCIYILWRHFDILLHQQPKNLMWLHLLSTFWGGIGVGPGISPTVSFDCGLEKGEVFDVVEALEWEVAQRVTSQDRARDNSGW